jgi:hypothetical protein
MFTDVYYVYGKCNLLSHNIIKDEYKVFLNYVRSMIWELQVVGMSQEGPVNISPEMLL